MTRRESILSAQCLVRCAMHELKTIEWSERPGHAMKPSHRRNLQDAAAWELESAAARLRVLV